MDFKDFTIELSGFQMRTEDDRRYGTFKSRVLASPAGEMAADQAVTVEYDDKDLLHSLVRLDRRELDREGLVKLGRSLGGLLLPHVRVSEEKTVREFFAESFHQVESGCGLRLRLRLQGELAVIPWEYSYVQRAGGDGMDGFLALDPRIAIVRDEAMGIPRTSTTLLSGDFTVVLAAASPADLPQLDLKAELTSLKESLVGVEGVIPKVCNNATFKKLQPLLNGAGVFHFIGHGEFNRTMGERPGSYTGVGSLVLEDERLPAEAAAILLRGHGVGLAVLGGCNTGRRDGMSVWSGIAPALVKTEIPAVVAHQYTIFDKCALAFNNQFYQALVGGLPIEIAVSGGRVAAYNADREGRDWGAPVLYLRAGDGRIFAGSGDTSVRGRSKQATEAAIELHNSEVKSGPITVGAVSGGTVIGTQIIYQGGAGPIAGDTPLTRRPAAASGKLCNGQAVQISIYQIFNLCPIFTRPVSGKLRRFYEVITDRDKMRRILNKPKPIAIQGFGTVQPAISIEEKHDTFWLPATFRSRVLTMPVYFVPFDVDFEGGSVVDNQLKFDISSVLVKESTDRLIEVENTQVSSKLQIYPHGVGVIRLNLTIRFKSEIRTEVMALIANSIEYLYFVDSKADKKDVRTFLTGLVDKVLFGLFGDCSITALDLCWLPPSTIYSVLDPVGENQDINVAGFAYLLSRAITNDESIEAIARRIERAIESQRTRESGIFAVAAQGAGLILTLESPIAQKTERLKKWRLWLKQTHQLVTVGSYALRGIHEKMQELLNAGFEADLAEAKCESLEMLEKLLEQLLRCGQALLFMERHIQHHQNHILTHFAENTWRNSSREYERIAETFERIQMSFGSKQFPEGLQKIYTNFTNIPRPFLSARH